MSQTIHPVYTDGPDESPLFFIVPGDGSRAYCIGEPFEIEPLIEKLLILRDSGYTIHDGVLADTDPAIHEHISVNEAANEARLTTRAIRKACERGDITSAIKVGRDWSIPVRRFRHWARSTRKRGPKPTNNEAA